MYPAKPVCSCVSPLGHERACSLLQERQRERLVDLLFEARRYLPSLHPLRDQTPAAIVADTEARDPVAAEASIVRLSGLIGAVLALTKNELLRKHCAAVIPTNAEKSQ